MATLNDYRNKKGHIVIPLSREMVIEAFGGYGICDWCSETDEQGFLIPVLGHKWYCRKCKKDWEGRAIFYQEDASYENRVAMEMLKQIVLN